MYKLAKSPQNLSSKNGGGEFLFIERQHFGRPDATYKSVEANLARQAEFGLQHLIGHKVRLRDILKAAGGANLRGDKPKVSVNIHEKRYLI